MAVMYVQGLSTRKVSAIVEQLGGQSAGNTSAPLKTLAKVASVSINLTQMKKIRIGLVGGGRVSQRHVDSIGNRSDAELVAVADPSEKSLEQLTLPAGIVKSADSESLLRDPQVDAVFICTPHFLHHPYAMLALQNGKHVFVEKPMGNTPAECAEVNELAAHRGLQVAVGHHHSFLPAIKKMKEILDSGVVGEARLILDRMILDTGWAGRTAWWKDKKMAGGGILMNTGVHQIDRLLFLAGKNPTSVYASVGYGLPGLEVDTDYSITIRFDGLTGLVVGTSFPCGSDQSLEVVGTKGRLWVDLAAEEAAYTLEDGEVHRIKAPGYMCGIEEMAGEFLDAIHKGRPCRVSGQWGGKVVEIADAAYRSQDSRREIAVA